jgi:hypothetical protein
MNINDFFTKAELPTALIMLTFVVVITLLHREFGKHK